jgi:hypothetical protein
MRCEIVEIDGETLKRAEIDNPPAPGDLIVIEGRKWHVEQRTLDWDEKGNDHVFRIGVVAN